MARTDAATQLTEQHRQLQLQVRSQALRDFAVLWPIWKVGDDASFGALVAATLPLVRVYNRMSSGIATGYYRQFRSAEEIAGPATPRPAPGIEDGRVTTSLYVTGRTAEAKARSAGQNAAGARNTALVRASGAVTRHVLQGGRDALIRSVDADPEARGWARVTDTEPCAFCAMLAGRGPVYKTEQTAAFEAHDHCSCIPEPVYPGADWPGRGREFADLYKTATRDAHKAGELKRGTSNDLLNAFRRAYEHQR